MSDSAPSQHVLFPSVSDVDRIAARGDPVLRNLQITQCYYELSKAVAQRSGAHANWCTFAAWASRQAGQSIRKEDLRRALERAVSEAINPPTAEAAPPSQAMATPAGAGPHEMQAAFQREPGVRLSVDRVADAVARGNRKVFEEIGRIFALFLAKFYSDDRPDPVRLAHFCATLRPGDPPDGQEYLRQAFTRYYQSFFEDDPKKRAELLFFANIEIGYHEQTRLQPEIAEALNAAFVNIRGLAKILLSAGMPSPISWMQYPLWLARLRLGRATLTDRALDALLDAVQARTRHALTEILMTLRFPPDQVIRLGGDLNIEFPEILSHLADAELSAFIAVFDPTPDSPSGTGASDWADLTDRLRFIIHLFRSYQELPDLFAAPFLPEQTTAIKSDRLPVGRL